ncbi:MAG: alpha-L-fucosidase [Oscillospiraceae bacterium]|nr:alpha-L-fucosidase [Oscillospiraceae bacterium]
MFEPTFASLGGYECPDWFRDAKFGIWSHWGPQSVPMCGDWYARHMYVEGSQQYLYHLRHYGHPSKFGYKDIVKLWKAEAFDPAGLMALYHRAGARYFVAQAMHHDHFFNYPSKLNRFNSMDMGPGKDIVGMWKTAAEQYSLPFGLTEHLGASFSWWAVNKGSDKSGPYAGVPYDGSDPAYSDFYFENTEHITENGNIHLWYTLNEKYHAYWLAVMRELIGLYQPDLLYTDGALPFGSHWCEDEASKKTYAGDALYTCGLEAAARLYNASIEKYGENRAVYTQKDRRPEIHRVGVLDIEKSQLPGIQERPWQTDTCIGGWFYDAKRPFKKPGHIIEMLVDIVSKNGTMLLNILQRPDGAIDDEARWILGELAGWFAACGEGIYSTRPWRACGEGPSGASSKPFCEDEVEWTSSDIRFTRKGNTLYAFLMRAASPAGPDENGVAVIKSLTPDERVRAVRLLGGGALEFAQSFGVLTVKLPEKLPTGYVNCLALEMEAIDN